ncbi:glycerol-3-phosphate 1-O-acyltransferase PlsY [Yoonia sp. 208BN28-4]|uniref:glycerol-3-phosphate 1-O-acyltransferase PlsY n=1 Tax=Yoonia sp. 208BN28-4 TaxID=3126505 RepID=UPI0030A16F25
MVYLWCIIGYLIGSIPFGILVSKMMGLGNLRDIGSGNIGATNVLRTGSKKAAILTLAFDAGKGALVIALARLWEPESTVQLAAIFALLGHCFPVWLGFRGGKGVATFLGIVFALWWPLGLAACATWLVVAAIFRFSSLAGMLAAGFTPIWGIVLDYNAVVLSTFIMSILIYIRHAPNITRLRAGTEPKIGQK